MSFNQLKKMAMATALVFVMIGAAGLGWAADVSFNYTVTLKWEDYLLKTEDRSARGTTDAGHGLFCDGRSDVPETKTYTQTQGNSVIIPFKQDVELSRSSEGKCDDYSDSTATAYAYGGSDWKYFTKQTMTLPQYEGNLNLQVYANAVLNDCWDGGEHCTVTISVTYYEKTSTTDQQKIVGPNSASIPMKDKVRQELTRISVPTSQFEDPNAKPPTKGLVRFLPSACTATTDKPSEISMSCEQKDDQFVVYAYSKAAIDEPMAPFASIASIRSSGKLGDVVKAVKWKDDEFQKGHEVTEFVGQATDVDGSVVEYRWEADGQVLSNDISFFYSDLTLGRHTISFKAKDNSGLWSTVSTKIVDVVKPPVLMVHGLNSAGGIWNYATSVIQSSYPNVETINIEPNIERFSYGAEKVSEKIKEMTEKYGIPKVNILAHSMGGLNSRWYIQSPGYRNDVNKLVMLGTPNHGSTLAIFLRPDESGSHKIVYDFWKYAATALWEPLGDVFSAISAAGYLVPAATDLIPGSSALRYLNGNKKDEGYSHDESTDNVRTVYGNRVQYFNIVGRDWPSFTHEHFQIPQLGIYWYWLVLPWVSFDTDLVVCARSANLNDVPAFNADGIWHNDLHEHSGSINKANYFFGDDPPKTDPPAEPNTDITKALTAHPIFAPKNGEYSAVSAEQPQEQKFDVEPGIRNFHVILMPPAKDGDTNLLSLRLVSPSGEIIDENTNFPDVKYNPKTMVYQIFNAEIGTWTAEISTTSGIPLKYALIVMGETDFFIGVREEAQSEPGKPIMITAYAQKEGKPAPGLKVKASVVRTFDEGERIGSKYGKDLRDAEPEEVELTDLGDGRYEVNYTNTLASGTYRVFITATDPASNVSRMAFTTFFVEYSYDFSIQSADISFSNNSPQSNDMITVSATVHNNTPLEAKGVEVMFSDGSLGKDGKTFGKTVIDLPASGTSVATLSWRIPAGLHDVFVIVSPMNTFIEENIQNNIASNSIATPDRSPTANAGGKERISRFDVGKSTNFPIVLDASGSTDDLKIEKYEWDINPKVDSNGDGIPDNDADFTGVRAVIPAGTFTTQGDYQVKLTLTDSKGQKSSDTMLIHLKDAYDYEPPKANAGKFQTVPAGYPVQFDGSGSTDNFGVVAYMWDTDINVDSNGDGIPDNDIDLIGMKPVLESGSPSKGLYTAKLTVSDAVGNLASGTVKILVSDFKSGVFIVEDTGIVKIDWLYDGGRYQGEFGIFNLAGMENLTPGSPEFIAEAVKRVLSNSDQGYLVFSDLQEGARFSGLLGGEVKDWNAGPYKGVKSFTMKPGSQFASVLVPNSTFTSLAQNPATPDPGKRPLFSLVSANPAYGMNMGQMADINGMGKAYSYEDKDAAASDWDYNDLIVQITGAVSNVQTIDQLWQSGKSAARKKRDGSNDWRNTDFGKLILAHVESSAPINPITVTLKGSATLLVYDAQGGVIGKSGGTLIGAGFEMTADTQTATLPNTGSYRIVIQGVKTETCLLSVKDAQGSLKEIQVNTALHQVFATSPALETPTATASYDFNGDGVVDNTDVEMLVKHWNSCRGQQKYDPFFDVNDDGCITVADIMTVLNAKTVK